MTDATLQPVSPLLEKARLGRSGRMDGDAGVVVCEIRQFHAIHIASRRAKVAEVRAILSAAVGVDVSAVASAGPRRFSGNGLALIGVAPDQWFAVERGTERHRLNALRDSLAGLAAISEQGAGKVILEISGRHARDALCKGIAVDLDPAAFTVGSSAQTVAAHIGVQVSLLDDAPTFELISAGSTAASLWSWLAQSAREFGFLVA